MATSESPRVGPHVDCLTDHVRSRAQAVANVRSMGDSCETQEQPLDPTIMNDYLALDGIPEEVRVLERRHEGVVVQIATAPFFNKHCQARLEKMSFTRDYPSEKNQFIRIYMDPEKKISIYSLIATQAIRPKYNDGAGITHFKLPFITVYVNWQYAKKAICHARFKTCSRKHIPVNSYWKEMPRSEFTTLLKCYNSVKPDTVKGTKTCTALATDPRGVLMRMMEVDATIDWIYRTFDRKRQESEIYPGMPLKRTRDDIRESHETAWKRHGCAPPVIPSGSKRKDVYGDEIEYSEY